MSNSKTAKSFKLAEIIAILAFIVSVFSIGFSVYQYQDQKEQSRKNDSLAEKRFDAQFKEIRKNDSEQIATAKQNISISTDNFKIQFREIHSNDSIQNALTIYNSKNSVKPLLQISKVNAQDNPIVGIQLQNAGFGPAIIDSLMVYFDGEISDLNDIGSFARHLNLYCWNSEKYSVTSVILGIYSLKAGGVEWLFEVPSQYVNDFNKFQDLMNNHIDITIKYHSLTFDHYIVRFENSKYSSAYYRR